MWEPDTFGIRVRECELARGPSEGIVEIVATPGTLLGRASVALLGYNPS